MRRFHGFRQIAGVRTSVYDSGVRPGRPAIVMVHGGDPRSLANGLDWSSVWAPDALDARLIAYDKPGQGYSYEPGMAASAAGIPALAAHLEELVEDLDAPVVLMGHSRGALPVAQLALRRPELIAGLVLVSSNTLAPPSDATPADFYPRAYADPPAVLDEVYLRREPEMNSVTTAHVDRAFLDGRREPAEQTGWWDDLSHRRRMYDEIVPAFDAERQQVLAAIRDEGFRMPVLQIWGGGDISAPVVLAHSLFEMVSRRTEDATGVILAGAAHYVYREFPERFLAYLSGFLGCLSPEASVGAGSLTVP